jgi:hypothetical protein
MPQQPILKDGDLDFIGNHLEQIIEIAVNISEAVCAADAAMERRGSQGPAGLLCASQAFGDDDALSRRMATIICQYCCGWGTQERPILCLLRTMATTTDAELRDQALIAINKLMAGAPGPRYHKHSRPIALILGSLRYTFIVASNTALSS